MISERKQFLLKTIIKEYIKSAQAVSSTALVNKYKLDISPATVRNEMMELENENYIYQPHTSSGRIPTEKAYKLFLDAIADGSNSKELKVKELKELEDLFDHQESAYKQTAKAIADLSGGAVFWAFNKNDLYYTGLANLFSQPEFKKVDIVCDVSGIIDRLEEIIDDIFESLENGQQVLIGSDNPFGNFLSTVLLKYKNNKQSAIFGILGPLRMDYEHNLSLVNFIKNKFN